MDIQTVCFDRVFDVQSGMFSFEAGTMREYSVIFDHTIVPRAGDTYAVALSAPGNWQQIVGWRDLSTGKLWLRCSPWSEALDLVLDLYFVGIAITAAALVFGGIWAALVAVILMLLGSVALVWRTVMQNREIRRALCAVPPAAPPAVPPAFGDVTPLSRRRRIVAGLTSLFG